MAYEKYTIADGFVANLNTSIWASDTSVILQSWQGSWLVSGTQKTILRFVQYDTPADPTTAIVKSEYILCTNRSGDTLTITRGFDSSTPATFNSWDYVYCINHTAVTEDIQDEVARLESEKLNKWGLRTSLTNAWRMFFSNWSNNETELAFWASGRILQSNGATSAPTWVVPTVDINSLTEDTTGNLANDFFVKNNGTWANTKIKLTRYKASDADVTTGTEDTKYITAAKLPKKKVIQTTRDISATSWTVSIAHWLSRTPKYCSTHMKFVIQWSWDTTWTFSSDGFSDGSNNYCVYTWGFDDGSTSDRIAANDSANCIVMRYSQNWDTDTYQRATITFDATNINIIWAKTGSHTWITGYITIILEA